MDNNQEKINVDIDVTSNSDKKIKEIESQIAKLDVQAEGMRKKLEKLQIPSVNNDSINRVEKYNAGLEKYRKTLKEITDLHRELLKQKEISSNGNYVYVGSREREKFESSKQKNSKKENPIITEKKEPSVFAQKYVKLPKGIQDYNGSKWSDKELDSQITQYLESQKKDLSIKYHETINDILKQGGNIQISTAKRLAESLANDQFVKSSVRQMYSPTEKKDAAVRMQGYTTFLPEGSKKILYGSYYDKNGEVQPSVTPHIYGDVLSNKDKIGGIGNLNGKSLSEISTAYEQLRKAQPKGESDIRSYADAIQKYMKEVLKTAFSNLENGTATPAESKLVRQVQGQSYDTGEYYRGNQLDNELRASIQHIDSFSGELNGDIHDNPPEKKKYMGSELSSTEIKQEEAKVKTGMTGAVSNLNKEAQDLFNFFQTSDFTDSIKETASIEGSKGVKELFDSTIGNFKSTIDESVDGLDRREIATDLMGTDSASGNINSETGRYVPGYIDKDDQIVNDTEIEEGRQEAVKKAQNAMSQYTQVLTLFQNIFQQLYDDAKTAEEKANYAPTLKKINSSINKIGNQYENGTNNPWTHKDIDGKNEPVEVNTNVPANALSNYITKGSVFRSSVKNYANKSGMDEQDALRQSIESMEDEQIDEIKDSINARKRIDQIIEKTTSQFKGKISNIGETGNKEFDQVLTGLQGSNGTDILSNLSSYTSYVNDYKAKISQFGNSGEFEKQEEFVKSFEGFISSIQSSFSSLKENTDDKGLKRVLTSVESLFGDTSSFIDFIQKFSSETYGIGQRSFNYNEEEAKKNKNKGEKEEVFPDTPKWEERAPKERFIGQTQGLDYLAPYGATDLDTGIANAEKRLADKKEILSSGDDTRKEAWDAINQIEQEREEAQSIIDEIVKKYPTTTTKNRGTIVNWKLAQSGEWSDISTDEIAQDRNAYNNAKKVLKSTKSQNKYEDAQSTLKEVGSYSDNIFKEIETIEDNLKFMRELSEQRKKAMEKTLGTKENISSTPNVALEGNIKSEKDIEPPNLEDLANWSEKIDENTPVVPPTNGNPPSNNNYEGNGSFNIENADVKINNGNPITITQGIDIVVNGDISKKVNKTSTQDFKDREFSFEEEAQESEYEAKRDISRLGQKRIPELLKETGVQEDVTTPTMVNGIPVSTKTNPNIYSDEELKKIIDEKIPLVTEDKSGGQVFSAKDAVRNYLKADEDQIKLIGQRVALLAEEKQLREQIKQAQNNSTEKDKASTKLAENQNKLKSNQRQIEEEEQKKGITGVEEAFKNGNLGWATSTYEEQMKMRQSKVTQAINVGLDKGQSNQASSNASVVKQYLSDYQKLLNIQSQIQTAQKKSTGLTGQQKQAQDALVSALQKKETIIAANMATYQKADNEHINGTLNGKDLSDSEKNTLLNGVKEAEIEAEAKTAAANTQLKQQKGLLSQIAEGFRASFRNLVDYSISYRIIGMITQSFQTLISTTKTLNTNMLNLRIVTGEGLKETRNLMLEYNSIATELGRTTESVADASNDWLRAGYQGKEAVELTRASLQLSTLGMIDASSATTDLISVLKGWKLQASDVSGVVDKLTVTICGVYIVICIGHRFNCR